MKQRKTLPTMLVLLHAAERFRRGAEHQADRQLIDMLLSGIAADNDVRAYFWETVTHRPKGNSLLKHWAAVVAAVAEARGEKRAKGRIRKAVEATGLTEGQVEHAIREHGADARFKVEMFGANLHQLEQWAESAIAAAREVGGTSRRK